MKKRRKPKRMTVEGVLFAGHRERKDTWNAGGYFWKARIKGFRIMITMKPNDQWFVMFSHLKKDIRYNTKWDDRFFESEFEAMEYATKWNPTKAKSLEGDDIKLAA